MVAIRRRWGETGSTLIEVAAILPILLGLTFATIDFGRYIYMSSAVLVAAQEGARAGLGQDGIVDLAAATRATQQYVAALDVTLLAITVDQPTAETVAVKVTCRFEFITPIFIALFPGNQLDIDGAATMAIY